MKIIILLSLIVTIINAEETVKIISDVDQQYDNTLKIINGANAAANQFPYQVALKRTTSDTTAFCGGALISLNYVLTAAQCVDGLASVVVVLGALDISSLVEASQVAFTATRITVYPAYNADELKHDIALIKLPQAATVSNAIRPVWLPTYKRGVDTYVGQLATVSGWGDLSDTGNKATVLQFLNVPIISDDVCRGLSAREIFTYKNLCTSGTNTVGICPGDSGDPLVAVNNGITRLVGIASYGYLACQQSYPSIYTRVAYYLKWIVKNTDLDARLILA